MANTFKTSSTPAREVLAILENNKVMSGLANKSYAQEWGIMPNGYERGATVPIVLPANFVAENWDGSSATAQTATESVINMTLSNTDIVQVPVSMSVADQTYMIETFNGGNSFAPAFIQRVLNPMVEALTQKIDADLCEDFAKGTPYYYGTAGTTPSNVSDITGIRKILNNNKAPFQNRALVLDSDADAKMLELGDFHKVNEAGTSLALNEAMLGRKFGFDTYMDQNVYTHTAGTLTVATGDTIDVKGAVAVGATSIIFDSTSLVGGVKEGDIIVVTDVTNGTQNLVVTADATAASNELTVSIKPALVAIADNAVATLLGNGSSYSNNLAFHKGSVFHVQLPTAINPRDGFVISDPISGAGITVRIEPSTAASKSNQVTIECYSISNVRQECIARLVG